MTPYRCLCFLLCSLCPVSGAVAVDVAAATATRVSIRCKCNTIRNGNQKYLGKQ